MTPKPESGGTRQCGMMLPPVSDEDTFEMMQEHKCILPVGHEGNHKCRFWHCCDWPKEPWEVPA